MKEKIKSILRPAAHLVLNPIRRHRTLKAHKQDTQRVADILKSTAGRKRLFYLGVTNHSNLGDMGQYFCIGRWIRENYADHTIIEVEADIVVDIEAGFMPTFQSGFNTETDIIVFQSGYTTQDLGGYHDLMHRMVIEAIPGAKILMMPQTIFFQYTENRDRTARIYNSAKNMLFLARDMVSFEMAKEMFPDIRTQCYPDIVTTLIGQYTYNDERNGICLCRRDDGEKFYSEDSLMELKQRLEEFGPVTVCDTTISTSFKKIRQDLQGFIERQIAEFAQYKVMITDRYHGTIFALAAGTPVVIIKTNDHKVVTGADWFKGVYDSHIFVAEDLDDAYRIASRLTQNPPAYKLEPHFKANYYDKLKSMFEAR